MKELYSSVNVFIILLFVLLLTANSSPRAQGLPITAEVCNTCTIDEKDYLLYLPETYTPGNSYKLIIFLHGLQQQANWDVELLRNKGLMRVIGKTDVFDPYKDDYIVMAPFTREDTWKMEDVREMFDHIITRFPSINDIFITGMSMGGKGTWDFAIRYPDDVTGIVPLWSNVNVGSYDGSDSTFTLCNLADVAIWTIDGASDPKFPPEEISADRDGSNRWGTGIVTDALRSECNPQIDPVNDLWVSKTHNGWDEVYDLTAGYDIYQWIDQLSKINGIIEVDGQPIVTIDPPATISSASNRWSVYSRSFDPEGQVLNRNWTVMPTDPAQRFSFESHMDELVLRDFDPGVYTVQLNVDDGNGNSKSVSTTLSVLNDPTGFAEIENTSIFSYDAGITFEEILSDSNAFSFSTIGTDLLNFRAEGNTSTNSIRFALNGIGNFRTENRTATGYLGLSGNSDYVATPGDYILTVTACADNFCDIKGLSRQYIVRFQSEALPVTFAGINVNRHGASIRVEWKTAVEYSNSHFEVLRWTDSDVDKTMLATIPKSKEAPGMKSYTFLDEFPPNGAVYYQVVNVDNDGGRQYSEIVNVGGRKISSILNNPVKAGEAIRLPELVDGEKPRLYSPGGLEINVEYSESESSIRINVPGFYIIHLPEIHGPSTHKIIVAGE